jgi:hypothetical protein
MADGNLYNRYSRLCGTHGWKKSSPLFIIPKDTLHEIGFFVEKIFKKAPKILEID